jgi:hypothetical protein
MSTLIQNIYIHTDIHICICTNKYTNVDVYMSTYIDKVNEYKYTCIGYIYVYGYISKPITACTYMYR